MVILNYSTNWGIKVLVHIIQTKRKNRKCLLKKYL